MPLEQLSITTETVPNKDVVIIALKGYLDSHTFDHLQNTLADLFDSGVYKIVMDMAQLSYMSSAGAGVLIGAMSQTANNNGKFVIASMPKAVLDVFQELGLAEVFQLEPSREAALATF